MSSEALPIEDWRDTAAYDFFDDLTPSALAWECLRRNRAYGVDLQDLKRIGTDGASAVADRWGLRFRGLNDAQRPGPDDALVAERRSFDPVVRTRPRRSRAEPSVDRAVADADPPRASA